MTMKMTMTQRRGTEMKTKLLQLIGATALLFGAGGMALADTVGFNPDPANVNVGDIFSVDIVGIEFTELAGGEFDLGFDSTVLRIDSVVIAPHWDFLPNGGGPADGNIWRNVGFDINDGTEPASGNFAIATVNLTALAEGNSSLVILNSFFADTSVQLFPMLIDGTVNVSAVPVPAAVWLFGSGLLGLIGIARRKVS